MLAGARFAQLGAAKEPKAAAEPAFWKITISDGVPFKAGNLPGVDAREGPLKSR